MSSAAHPGATFTPAEIASDFPLVFTLITPYFTPRIENPFIYWLLLLNYNEQIP